MQRHHLATTGLIARILALALLSSGLLAAATPSSLAATRPALVLPAQTLPPNVTGTSFAVQTVGTTSPTQTVTFAARGGAVDILATPPVTGANTADFALSFPPSGGCVSGTSLATTGDTCTIWVAFTPTAAGVRTATMTVTDTATDAPQEVALSGIGQVVATGVSPGVLNFYNQAIGTTSTARAVALANGGPTTITVSSVGIISGTPTSPGPDFSIVPGSDTCTGQQVAPNAACTVGIVFSPTAEGSRTGFIFFVDNGTGSPHLGLLLGRGVHTAGYWLSASDGGI